MKVLIAAALAALLAATGCMSAAMAARAPHFNEGKSKVREMHQDFDRINFDLKGDMKKVLLKSPPPPDSGVHKSISIVGHLFPSAGAGGKGRRVKDKRKMIYTAQFALKVYDLEKSARKIIKLTEKAGGYVSTQTNESVVVRVPAGKFREIVDALDDVGQVVSKNIQAQDVTQQYMDLSLRIGAKRKYLETLQKLLDKTTDAKALLEIQKEIGRIIEEMESLEGRLRYLGDQVAYSTISVRLLLATQQQHRRFRLPIGWIERLGIDHLVMPGGGAR